MRSIALPVFRFANPSARDREACARHIHPGAMGTAVGACLVDRGHEVGWLRTGRSEATRQRAAQARLTPFDDLAELLDHADIVFSICPPHGALDVARALAGFQGIVVDANAISPEAALLIGRTVTRSQTCSPVRHWPLSA